MRQCGFGNVDFVAAFNILFENAVDAFKAYHTDEVGEPAGLKHVETTAYMSYIYTRSVWL